MTDSPIVKINWVSGTGETAVWAWYNEAGVQQGEEAGYALGATASYTDSPGASDPLTQMIQAAHTYAAQNGYALELTGQSYDNNQIGESPFLNLLWPLTFGVCGDTKIRWNNTIALLRLQNGGNGLIFDSCELMDFDAPGCEILYRGASPAALLQPKTRTPYIDNNLSINTGRINLRSVTVQPQNQCQAMAAVIQCDPTYGPIASTELLCAQIAGGNLAAFGIQNLDPVSSDENVSSIQHMIYKWSYLFGTTEACIKNGMAVPMVLGLSRAPTITAIAGRRTEATSMVKSMIRALATHIIDATC